MTVAGLPKKAGRASGKIFGGLLTSVGRSLESYFPERTPGIAERITSGKAVSFRWVPHEPQFADAWNQNLGLLWSRRHVAFFFACVGLDL